MKKTFFSLLSFLALGATSTAQALVAVPESVDLTSVDFSGDVVGAAAGALGVGVLAVQVLLFVLVIASLWKIFTKAGKPGWAAIIPVYNIIVFLEVIRKPWWWLILFLIPLVNIVFGIMATHRLSRSFGKGGGTTAGLLLLSIVFYPMLAFGDAKYTPLQD